MPKGASRPISNGDDITHFNGVRLRVVGTGSLKLTFHSLGDVRQQQLSDVQLSEETNIVPYRIANFTEQRASLEVGTDTINDYFKINRIIIYSRTVATMYPG